MTAWKDLERRVCRALGGERRGPAAGTSCSDCVNTQWAVEVKRSKRGVPEGKWIQQARAHATREQRPWILVVATHGDRDPIVVLQWKEFLRLRDEIEMLSCAEGEETEEAGEPTGGVAATLPFPLGGARRQPGGL